MSVNIFQEGRKELRLVGNYGSVCLACYDAHFPDTLSLILAYLTLTPLSSPHVSTLKLRRSTLALG